MTATDPDLAAGHLAAQLANLWAELDRRGATVNRVRLDSPPDLLRARVDHETRRVRALAERNFTSPDLWPVSSSRQWLGRTAWDHR